MSPTINDLSDLSVLAAFAHPDDEAFGVGGTLAMLASRGEGGRLRKDLVLIRLRLQYLPPGQDPLHQRAHTQLHGDGQSLFHQGNGLGLIAGGVTLEQGFAVIAAGPG